MRTLYLDLDDTYLDTDNYIRKVLKENGVSKKLWGINDYIYVLADNPDCKDIIKSCMSNYTEIPTKVGAKESLQLLRTEYNVVFVTSIFSYDEMEAKKELLQSMKVPFIFVGSRKNCVNMRGQVFVDNHLTHLKQSNAATKIFFYNEFEESIPREEYMITKDWFELTDLLMSGGEDFELRKYIHQRVQECCHTIRV